MREVTVEVVEGVQLAALLYGQQTYGFRTYGAGATSFTLTSDILVVPEVGHLLDATPA